MAVAGAVYVAMWFGWVRGWGCLVAVDTRTLGVARDIAVQHPSWVTWWDVVCTTFSPAAFRILALGLIVFAVARRQVRVALFLAVTVELSAVLTEVAKRLADRDRPETAMVAASSSSFPSGHALGTTVAVLALAVVLLPYLRRSLWPFVIAAGVLIVAAVGLGRVALNVHHLSDVVAGWALGYAYFAACLLLFERGPVTAADERPTVPDSARRS